MNLYWNNEDGTVPITNTFTTNDAVERLYPEAIHVSDTGYKMVDYNAIGVEMQEVA